ncbi:MAG: hypothetical protein K0S58_2510 [Nitrospira sp.]|jgi:hypothetical protein|nr:hypothetical protein [Nitrospira sp.]
MNRPGSVEMDSGEILRPLHVSMVGNGEDSAPVIQAVMK